MLRLIKEFNDINIFKYSQNISDIDTKISDYSIVNEICAKAKEIAINLNDEIKKKNISDNDLYKDINIHKITFNSYLLDPSKKMISYIKPDNNISLNPYNKNDMIIVNINGSQLKERLYKIPSNIMMLVSLFYEHCKTKGATYKDLILFKDLVLLLSKVAIELLSVVYKHNTNDALNESQIDNEYLDKYMNELKSIITEIREYYEKSDYSKILTPRKKQIDKMKEYVLGALERKYTLRIPLYKVSDASKTVRDIIENKFIKDIQGIIAKYDNYVLLSPNWDEDEDIYIYLTLKEPFGKKSDNNDRKTDSNIDQMEKLNNYKFDTNSNKILTESSSNNSKTNKLTKKERDSLSDDEFGLPSLRKYPLNDEEHIRQAIRFFHYCKGPNKQELANNIAKKVKEKNLIGKITISQKNPFKKYFPSWIVENGVKNDDSENDKKILKKSQNESIVFINGKLI